MSQSAENAEVIDILGTTSASRHRFITRAANVVTIGSGVNFEPVSRIRHFARNGVPFFSGGTTPAPATTTYYRLGAVDVGSAEGRRYWISTHLNFIDAPSPVGYWNTDTLTIISSWQS